MIQRASRSDIELDTSARSDASEWVGASSSRVPVQSETWTADTCLHGTTWKLLPCLGLLLFDSPFSTDRAHSAKPSSQFMKPCSMADYKTRGLHCFHFLVVVAV